MMLGYLLARSGVAVTVLEKHRDFFRDFRGDTVHPSTLELLYELGLLEEFLKLRHEKVTSLSATVGDFEFEQANFERLHTHCRFVAIMPQWDFLNFLSEQAKQYPTFDLRLEHEATDVLYENERITGVSVRTPSGTEHIRADLVVACDGRHSAMRAAAHLQVHELGVPIDVLWFRISRASQDPEQVLGRINFGKLLILINRGDYFQAGLVVQKNSFDQIKRKGIEAFRHDVARIAPFLGERVAEIKSWDDVKLLSVQINRLKRWHRPGLLCIGDAAHAMSPVFGVGINLAVQDAVAAANILARPLLRKENTDRYLERVQRRRELRTRITQGLQVLAHGAFRYIFRSEGPLRPSRLFKLVARAHIAQPIVLRVVGVGIVPEHVAGAERESRSLGSTLARTVGMAAGIAAAATVFWLGVRRLRND